MKPQRLRTTELTRASIKTAERLGAGLHAAIGIFWVLIVPIRPQQYPVHPDFLKEQMRSFASTLPLSADIVLASDFEPLWC